MEPSKDSDIEIVLEGELHQPIFPESPTSQEEQIDIVRAAVGLTKEAARAISITAIEAVREGALFMGVIGSRGELLDPFKHIDAAIWSESEIPEHMIETSYEFCEELTRREAGNF